MKKILSIIMALALFAPYAFAEENSFESLVLDIIKKNPQIIKEALEKYEKEAAEKQKEEEFKKLLADRAEVEIGESPVKGEKKADYTVIAFSDFQCPFCKRGDDTIKELQKKYDKKLKYVFKHFPLGFHPEAMPAAKAAWAAGKQGKFFEYHDKLFENQGKLGEELYVQIAKDIGLNIDKFNKDRVSEDADKGIKGDIKQAESVGIQGTPGFLLNGIKIFGAYPLDHFEKVISQLELEKATAQK
ncbi:MAG: thioredoxin domain-containing protein [Candidatus Melainabacteria bacterium]|nr:thioredoxin domain-containing protein [Candidatus Melainabacteria bacterium]